MNDQLDTAPQQLDPFTAGVHLQVVVDQLTQPTVVHLDRQTLLDPESTGYQQAADDQALADDAWSVLHHAAARDVRDLTLAARQVEALTLLARRKAAREAPTITMPSLLHQLQHAVAGSGNTDHGAPSTGAHRSPLALAAHDLVTEIGDVTGVRLGLVATPIGNRNLQEWCLRVCSDETQVVRAAELAADWPERARNLLDPPKKWTTPGKCPQCGKDTAYTQQDGEQHRRPAIEFDRANARARCLCCSARWEGEQQLRQLNKALTETEAS